MKIKLSRLDGEKLNRIFDKLYKKQSVTFLTEDLCRISFDACLWYLIEGPLPNGIWEIEIVKI